MPAGNFSDGSHPEELLAGYALDALDAGEARQVEAHLRDCARCRRAARELQEATALLGESVEHRAPPPALASRLMAALSQAAAPSTLAGGQPPPAGPKKQVARFILPTATVAAAVVVALFIFGVLMNQRLSGRVEGLEQENSTLTAQLAESSDESAQVAETVRQLQLTSYWLADPSSQPLKLHPPGGLGSSQGVLLMASDGGRAVVMVAGMRDLPSIYHIWLLRKGDRVWAGKLEVDERGWGTAWFQPDEPLFAFEKVELTAATADTSAPGTQAMVLEGKIPVPWPSQIPNLR
jgi:anti-sigma-K factor RskA